MDIFAFDSSTDAAAAPSPPGKRKGDAARRGRRRVALDDISNAPVKPRQLNRGEKEKLGLAIFAGEQNQIELLLKEKAVLKNEIADRDTMVELSMNELRKLRMEMQQLRQQNSLFAQEKSQMSAELRTGNDKLKVLEHELRCVRNVLKTKILEFQEMAKARRLHQQNAARMEVTVCRETEESSQVNNGGDDKPCSSKWIDQSKVSDTDTVNHVQTEEKTENRRRQSRRFEKGGLESAKAVVEAMEELKSVDKRRSLRRQSPCFKIERGESAEGKLNMVDAMLPVCPIPIAAKFPVHPEVSNVVFPVCPELKDGKHDDLMIPLASTVPETDVIEANINESTSASESTDLVGRPTRRAAHKVQSYKETPINRKMRRPD